MTTTITATAEPDASPPRVRLGITTDKSALNVWRVAQDGSRVAVRTYDGGPLAVTGTSTVLYDAEVPQGDLFTYTSDDTATTASAAVSVNSGRVWLVHPGVPTRSMPIELRSASEREAAASQSVRWPLGRQFPIVANDGVRKAATYTLVVETVGPNQVQALSTLLADLSPLLLNVPPDWGWLEYDTEYVAVGDMRLTNPGGYALFQMREWSLPCSVTSRPAGGTQAFNTYGVSQALYPTYAARKAAAATYGQAYDPK